jgi:hypothetical protein
MFVAREFFDNPMIFLFADLLRVGAGCGWLRNIRRAYPQDAIIRRRRHLW